MSNSGKDHTKPQGPWNHSKNDKPNTDTWSIPYDNSRNTDEN